MRGGFLVGVGAVVASVSAAVLVYTVLTPPALLGHPDPHLIGAGATPSPGATAEPGPVSRTSQGATRSAPQQVKIVPRTGVWLEIPALEIALPLARGSFSTNIPLWKAFVYPGTAWPGQPGNSYIYAHAQWGMFAGLFYARVGDAGYVHDYGSGKVLTFHVSRVVGKVAYNDPTWIEYSSSRPTLTLQTCVDWNSTSDRYVVQLT